MAIGLPEADSTYSNRDALHLIERDLVARALVELRRLLAIMGSGRNCTNIVLPRDWSIVFNGYNVLRNKQL
jgi:hypothetical protein